MAINITIQLQEELATILSVEDLEPLNLELSMLPDLDHSWAGSSDATKGTFASSNQSELESYFDSAFESITLSGEASTAIINIESNGGVLTSQEKFFVSKWVDRIHAKGDYATRDLIAYAGFSDDLCKVVNWIDGLAMTLNNITYSKGNWVFNGVNAYIGTGFVPDGNGNYKLDDAVFGVYMDRMEAASGVYLFHNDTNQLRAEISAGLLRGYLNASTPNSTYLSNVGLGKNLLTVSRASSTKEQATSNGETGSDLSKPSSGLPVSQINIGKYASTYFKGEMSMCLAGSVIGFDQLDFYAGFEDFRTSLHPEILYNMVAPTGQSVSYRAGDDKSVESSLLLHFRKAMAHWNGTAPKKVDFLTLSAATPNAFGGTEVFTDINGLQVYGDDYVINHYTGDAVYRNSNYRTGNITFSGWIDEVTASAQNGYTDWFVMNQNQYMSLYNNGSNGLNYAPISLFGTTHLYWTSSSYVGDTVQAQCFYSKNIYTIARQPKGAGWVYRGYQMRKHY